MTPRPTFNLIDEPWIRVRFTNSEIADCSLTDVFEQAPQIRGIAGEIPSEDAAILRLLLAIMLGATRSRRRRSAADSLDLWSGWWTANQFPETVTSYLQEHADRFDLLSETAPFFQVAGLTTDSGKRSGLGKLIGDLPDGHPYFTTRSHAEAESLSLAEAARWLVHCQAYDPSGIKSGAAGDPRVKGGKGYPFGYPAWTGNMGLVILEGTSLFQTLMLNLPLWTSGPQDLPVWEREPLTPTVETGPSVDAEGLRLPAGPADLFTWPSRRVRLFVEDDRVVDVQISNGDKRAPQNLRGLEPMCAWRRSENQSKGGRDVFMPVMHDPSRQVWQGLGALLQDNDDPKRETTRSRNLSDLGVLINNGELPRDFPVDIHIVGIEYGPQNSTIAGMVDDRLTASVAALTDPVLVQTAIDGATSAREGAIGLANLAGDLDKASGGDGAARDRTFEKGYAALDAPYRAWIRTLEDPSAQADYRADWARRARPVLLAASDLLVQAAGPAGLMGRKVHQVGNDELVLLDAGVALGRFHHKLNTAFPLPTQDR